jgi:hypothetical protein
VPVGAVTSWTPVSLGAGEADERDPLPGLWFRIDEPVRSLDPPRRSIPYDRCVARCSPAAAATLHGSRPVVFGFVVMLIAPRDRVGVPGADNGSATKAAPRTRVGHPPRTSTTPAKHSRPPSTSFRRPKSSSRLSAGPLTRITHISVSHRNWWSTHHRQMGKLLFLAPPAVTAAANENWRPGESVTMLSVLRLTAVAIGVLATIIAADAVPAAADVSASSPVAASCGAYLDHDAYLKQDLHCSARKGLTLAPGVVLDLRGHTLYGATEQFTSGVTLPDQGTVTIRNGSIKGWTAGVELDSDGSSVGGHAILKNLKFSDDAIGANLNAFESVFDISDTVFNHNDIAIQAFPGDANVTRSRLKNGRVGIVASDGGTVTLTNSAVAHMSDSGLNCTSGSDCVIDHDVLYDDHHAVLYAVQFLESRVIRSRLVDNDTGVDVEFGGSVDIERNRFVRNGTGINVTGNPVKVIGNYFARNLLGYTGATDGGTGPFDQTALLQDNHFIRNHGDGVNIPFVDGFARTNSFKNNRAFNNAGHGINAPGATDLGGNTAHGNATSPQCVGVVCSAGS